MNISHWLKNVELEEDELKGKANLPSIPQPETPAEPMEFLSRSWSLSANEISKALTKKQIQQPAFDKNSTAIPEIPNNDVLSSMDDDDFRYLLQAGTLNNNPISVCVRRKGGAIGRFFHHLKEEPDSSNTMRKKDKARIQKAHLHTILSIAGLSAALAAVTSAQNSKGSSTKMSNALASATQLLASYCIDMAELAGVEHEHVASVVKSAVEIHSASDLVTLTAAAATALRGEIALKAREAKRSAAIISPYEKGVSVDVNACGGAVHNIFPEDPPSVGDLLQHTQKGVLRWKHVSVYINKKCQVIIKLQSKHVGGAFSKKHKCVVYEVIDGSEAWRFKNGKENMEAYFGVKTAQGLLEFKTKNKIHKQKWVDGIQKLLQKSRCAEDTENSLRMLKMYRSI